MSHEMNVFSGRTCISNFPPQFSRKSVLGVVFFACVSRNKKHQFLTKNCKVLISFSRLQDNLLNKEKIFSLKNGVLTILNVKRSSEIVFSSGQKDERGPFIRFKTARMIHVKSSPWLPQFLLLPFIEMDFMKRNKNELTNHSTSPYSVISHAKMRPNSIRLSFVSPSFFSLELQKKF